MTSFDLLIFVVIALSIGFAVIRGGLREIGTLIALGAAAGLALFLAGPILSAVGVKASFLSVATLAAGIGVVSFAGFYVGLHVLLNRLKLKNKALRADRIGGGVFGLVRGVAVVGLGFLAYDYYLGEERRGESVNKALLLPVAQAAAGFFSGFAPDSNKLAPKGAARPASNAAVDGYARGERSALSEIVTTVTTSEDAPGAPGDKIADKIKETDPQ